MKSETEYDAAALKARGIMEQKQPGHFTIRLRVVGGRMEAAKLGALAGILADRALACAHLTTRQAIEIPNVRLSDVEGLCSDLAAAGLAPAALGPCVRTITACQGGSCRHGIIDSQRLAQRIDEKVSSRAGLPHKFKIGITGCPNGCIKPRENDLGIMGVVRKAFNGDACTGCGLCVRNCSSPGTLGIEGGSLVRRESLCVNCGKCVAICPTGAWELVGVRYVVFVGGKMGKQPRLGEELRLEILDEDHLLNVVEAAIEWYATFGSKKERFGDTLERIGVGELTRCLSSASLANRLLR